jgi:hypothetical protein
MESNAMQKVLANKSVMKFRAVVTGSTATAGVIYYFKPSIKSKLLGADLTLLTNTGNGTAVTISRTICTDTDLPMDEITISTNVSVTDITSSDVLEYALPNGALTTANFTPSSTITDAFLTVDPNPTTADLATYGNAVKILLADLGSGSEAMTGVLTLSFQPI